MQPALKIIEPGLQTTLQDKGRTGAQIMGVPVAGALDQVSLRLANHLVGNPPFSAALEILHVGPVIEVLARSVRIALAGQGAGLEIQGRARSELPPWRSVTIERGQVFRITPLREWSVAYLAVEGGFRTPAVLGSLSTYVPAGIGGFEGRALAAGDILPLELDAAGQFHDMQISEPPGAAPDQPVRVMLGPQDDAFTKASVKRFLTAEYTVTRHADRMGLRLEGAVLQPRSGLDTISDGIAPGSVQVPGNGLPIILLADRQTTGGYPKIATVISADLPVLGRRRPGDKIRFEAVDLKTARAAREKLEADIERIRREMVEPAERTGIEMDALYSENLISGVVGGGDSDPQA